MNAFGQEVLEDYPKLSAKQLFEKLTQNLDYAKESLRLIGEVNAPKGALELDSESRIHSNLLKFCKSVELTIDCTLPSPYFLKSALSDQIFSEKLEKFIKDEEFKRDPVAQRRAELEKRQELLQRILKSQYSPGIDFDSQTQCDRKSIGTLTKGLFEEHSRSCDEGHFKKTVRELSDENYYTLRGVGTNFSEPLAIEKFGNIDLNRREFFSIENCDDSPATKANHLRELLLYACGLSDESKAHKDNNSKRVDKHK